MRIKDYVFNIGDEVITTEGEHGKITSICNCAHCKARGFFEPRWVNEDGDGIDITLYDAEDRFSSYYKIGKYRFSPFDKERVVNQINLAESLLAATKRRLKFIEETEAKEAGDMVDYKDRVEKALEIACRYSQEDGSHHKAWAIDQMVRALCGTEEEYKRWIYEACYGEDGPDTYDWDVGIAP